MRRILAALAWYSCVVTVPHAMAGTARVGALSPLHSASDEEAPVFRFYGWPHQEVKIRLVRRYQGRGEFVVFDRFTTSNDSHWEALDDSQTGCPGLPHRFSRSLVADSIAAALSGSWLGEDQKFEFKEFSVSFPSSFTD